MQRTRSRVQKVFLTDAGHAKLCKGRDPMAARPVGNQLLELDMTENTKKRTVYLWSRGNKSAENRKSSKLG